MKLDQSTQVMIGRLLWLPALLLLALAGCGGTDPVAEPTAQPKGMDFDPASQVYELVPGSSEARFSIGEILRGDPKTVIGKTDQVSGQLAVNLADPAASAVGPIQVDVRALVTDDGFRNRAIETRILLSRVFQYVTFTPTAVTGLPPTVAVGKPVDFQIEGDLTIVESTKPVVFDVTAVPVSAARIEGSASAAIQRADFDLFVPSATGVAGVEETVRLEIDFVAEAVE